MSLHSCLQAPSATVVVKGLSLKTNDDDLYKILVQVPLHHLLHRLKVYFLVHFNHFVCSLVGSVGTSTQCACDQGTEFWHVSWICFY
jgi:hypothetical protein